MPRRVLHVLSQRPSRTGSGITLDSMVRQAAAADWDQNAVVAVPADDQEFPVGALAAHQIHPLRFASEKPSAVVPGVPFPVPGMSDVMPYPSSVWSQLSTGELADYRKAWRDHLSRVIGQFKPQLIHSHHIWLVSSMLKDLAPHIPVVTTCHATGLRQLSLCPHLGEEVIAGCRRIDHFFTLHQDHARQLNLTLGVDPQHITVVGAGYRNEVFKINTESNSTRRQDLVYVGKFSHAKGLPQLLNVLEEMPETVRLHVAGDGAGTEAEELRQRMIGLHPKVVLHGMLNQHQLANLLQRCRVCVLPSFYEGVPLVLVEAAACGCRLVSTALPGVVESIAPVLGPRLKLVPLPRLISVDEPAAEDLPRFEGNLAAALGESLGKDAPALPDLSAFTWQAVFQRVEKIWSGIIK